jgi:hypothetical protein
MTSETISTPGNRSPLTFYFMGRPASVYIEAMARRRHTEPPRAAMVTSSPHRGRRLSDIAS